MEVCNYSFDAYGMFSMETSAILCPVIIFLLYRDIAHLEQNTFNPHNQGIRFLWPFVLAVPIVFCTPVDIYFGVKFIFPTPSVYLLSAKLLCCCSEKRARALVLSLTLWFDLDAAYYIVGHGVFVLIKGTSSGTIFCCCECVAACVDFHMSHLHHGIGVYNFCICWYSKVSQEEC